MTNAAQKQIGIVVFTLLASAAALTTYVALLPAATTAWPLAAMLLVCFVVWLAVMLLTLAICRRAVSVILLTLVPGLVAIVISGFSPVVAGGALLLAIFTLLCQRTIVRDEQNRVYYRTAHFFSGAARLLALGLFIMLTSLAWPVVSDSVKTTRFEISDRQVAPFMRPIEPIIRDFFPGYSSDASIDELIDASLAEEKKKLPPGAVIDPVQEAQIRADLKTRLGENVTGNEGLASVVAGRINRQINDLAAQNPIQASVLLAVLAFLTLRALLPFVVWPTLGVLALLVKLAVQGHLVTISTQTVEMERLSL